MNPEKQQDVDQLDPQQHSPDRARIEAVLVGRRQKLEDIREHISLKTYYSVLEKLESDRQKLQARLLAKEQQAAIAQQPQALPKILFEQHFLRIKQIRID